jgi:HAE1 family hydrophobic/amphiphilic exporter-1
VQWLAEICVARPVFATVLILALGVVGLFGYYQLGLDLYPKVDFPVVAVVTTQSGTSPEEIESDITDEIERAVSTISGIEELSSTSSEGVSSVVVRFGLDKDINVAANEVRDKVTQVQSALPKDADSPLVVKSDPDATPIVYVAVSSDRPIREVSEFADKVVRRELESLSGVGEVRLVGTRLRQINVRLDPVRLRSYNLTAIEVSRAVGSQNVQFPAGTLQQGARDRILRMQSRARTVAELGDIIVANRKGVPVRLTEVAEVEDGAREPDTAAFVDDRPAVILTIRKQAGGSTVAIVKSIRARLAELEARIPAGYTLSVVQDRSEFIAAAVHTVQEHLAVGAFLTAVVVLLFLRSWRSTIIAAIAIPTSIVATFGMMWLAGFSLNVLTLLALTLAVGIVIDDAIVVLENIHRHMEEKGAPPIQAAVEGTREIGLAVLATTLSLVAVFLPVAFMGGIVGRFMNSFGLTMAFAIMVSLLVAFTLTPMLASRWLRGEHVQTAGHGGRVYGWIESGYERILRFSLGHRWLVVLGMVAALVAVVPLFQHVGKTFMPDNDESEFQVVVKTPEGTTLGQTELVTTRIAREVRMLPGVAYTVALVGEGQGNATNEASVYVRLVDLDERALSQFDVMDRARASVLPRFATDGVQVTLSKSAGIGGGGGESDVSFVLSGPDLVKLAEYSGRLMAMLGGLPGVVDVNSTQITGKPETLVVLDRAKAADLGVEVSDVGTTLRIMVGGQRITTYDEGGEEFEVQARVLPRWRTDREGLAQLTVPSARLGTVSLDNLARFQDGEGPAQISRLNRRRQVTIGANLKAGVSAQAVLDRLHAEVAAMRLPPGYSAGTTGSSKEMGNAAQNFLLAFGLSFVFMYLVLAAQFESWLYPALILLALPLTVPFALASISLFGQSLNIFTALGLLVLFGVVKKNAILQIDHVNYLRGQGLGVRDALLRADRERLRPILMTTFAFVAGALPLLLSRGPGSGSNRAIGAVIVGGQTLALLLTLVATPVSYSLVESVRAWHPAAAVRRRLGRPGKTAPPVAEPAEGGS